MLADFRLALRSLARARDLAGAAATTRASGAMRSGTDPLDPGVLASVTALRALVALLASWLPARRATRVSPTEALRSE